MQFGGPAAGVTSTFAEEHVVGNVIEQAFRAIERFVDSVAGGVYGFGAWLAVLVELREPHPPVQGVPFCKMVQFTPAESFVTVAVKVTGAPPALRVALGGDTETPITGEPPMVIVAEAIFVGSFTEEALSVTVLGLGCVPGAV